MKREVAWAIDGAIVVIGVVVALAIPTGCVGVSSGVTDLSYDSTR